MRTDRTISGRLVASVLAAATALAGSAFSQVVFTHGAGSAGVAGKRSNDLLLKPDPGDVFFSRAKIGKPRLGRNEGNQRLFDDSAADLPAWWLGISDADHIDALQVGVVDIFRRRNFKLDLLFSVAPGAAGTPGSRVAAAAPDNGAHLYASRGLGWHAESTFALQLGMTDASDVQSVCSNRAFRKVAKDPTDTPVLFTLSAGSPFLAAGGVSPGDILFVIPGPASFPALLVEAADLGLDSDDEIDAMAVVAPATISPTQLAPYAILFSVDSAADGLPGSAVASGGAADIYWSVGDGTNHLYRSAADLGLDAGDDLDALDVLLRTRVRHPDGEKIARQAPPADCARGGLKVAIRGGNGPGDLALALRVRASNGQELLLTSESAALDDCRDPVEIEIALLFLMSHLRVSDPVSGRTTPVFTTPARRRTRELDGTIVETSLEMKPHPLLHSLGCCIVGAKLTFAGDCQTVQIGFPHVKKSAIEASELSFFLGGTALKSGSMLLQLGGMKEPLSVPLVAGDNNDTIAAKVAAMLSGWTVVVTPGQPFRISADSAGGTPLLGIEMAGFDAPDLGLQLEAEARILPNGP